MFYEERITDGVLLCRSAPFGSWRRAITKHADAVNELLKLSPARRLTVFSKFCIHCGIDDPKCRCWNDE